MIDPLIASAGSYLLALTAVGAAISVAFGKDFLNVSIALFVELLALSGIFLNLGADYLAIFTLVVAVIAPILVVSFASAILGNLRERTLENAGPSGTKILRFMGFFMGVSIGVSVALVLMDLPLLSVGGGNALHDQVISKVEPATAVGLGQALLGEQVIVFELMAIITLAMSIGAGILLRRQR